MHRIVLFIVLNFCLIFDPGGSLRGSGTRVDYVDAFAVGRGNAFSATADNPSAVYYNPAGITQLEGIQSRVGGYAISLNYNLSGAREVPMDDEYQVLPSLFVTGPLEILDERAHWGLGIYAPFGLATDWPDASPFFAVADRSELLYLTLHPVFAWEVNEKLSIGGGPTVNFAELQFDQSLTGFFYDGEDTSYGWVLSALWEPWERHGFALVYRSRTTSDFSGGLELPVAPGTVVPAEGRASFPFPESWRAGYRFNPTPLWNLEANFEWMNWDVLDTVILENPVAAVPFVFDWESSWFYEFGATRFFENGFHLSAGYVWVENSIPDATFTPIVPDSDRTFLSLGLGFRGERWSWDAVIQHGFGDRTIAQPGAPAGMNFAGTYETDSLAFTVSLSYLF